MRKLLAVTAALAPLCLAAQAANAETTVSNERNTTIRTSTAANGAPDDVTIATNGVIRITPAAGTNVGAELDTPGRTVKNQGQIRIENMTASQTATGILVTANSGTVNHSGTISLTDDVNNSTTNSDGVLSGEWASGTGRDGILVQNAFSGTVTSTGAITVEGNASHGIRIAGDMTGDLIQSGNINIRGDNSVGVRTTGAITGKVDLGGGIDVRGEGARAVSIEGAVNGAVVFDGTAVSSGYRYTTRNGLRANRDKIIAAAVGGAGNNQLAQSGPTFSITGNVSGGFVLDAPPPNTNPNSDDDDGDGVKDVEETRGNLVSYGSAPALQIGGASGIQLGNVGTGDNLYGVILRGDILADGVYGEYDVAGVTATGVRIGGGGGTVDLSGGLRQTGNIDVISWHADSTGIHFAAGANVLEYWNSGTIEVLTESERTTTTTGVLIDSGASVPTIRNRGKIEAALGGETGFSSAITDRSNSLTLVENSGIILSRLVITDTDDGNATDVEERTDGYTAVAIDASTNSNGLTVRQLGVNDGDDGADGTADPDADGDGVDDLDEPSITGRILFGSGADTLDLQNGTMVGDVSFGGGLDQFLVSGGASYEGAITDSGGGLNVSVANGKVVALQTAATNITNLTVGANGDLVFAVNPASSSGFVASGDVNIAAGAGLGVRLNNLLAGTQQTFTVVQGGGAFNVGAVDTGSLTDSPYLYVTTATVDAANKRIDFNVRQRTAAEAGMIGSEADAYAAVLDGLRSDEGLRDLVLGQLTRGEFFNVYEQLLPEHNGDTLLSLHPASQGVARALASRDGSGSLGDLNIWLQETSFYADRDKGEAYGFRTDGIGVVGGLERVMGEGQVAGLSFGYASGTSEDPEAEGDEQLNSSLLELGVYYRVVGENWRAWARAAGGYASFDGTRQLVADGVIRQNEADWNGFTASAAIGASYDVRFGRYYLRPEFRGDYFMLNEDEREENGGGNGFDALLEARDSRLFTASAMATFGANFGEQGWFRPELRLGWRQIFGSEVGDTVGRFRGAPTSSRFRLAADSLDGGGPVLGFRFFVGNQAGFLTLDGEAELLDAYQTYLLMLRAGFRF